MLNEPASSRDDDHPQSRRLAAASAFETPQQDPLYAEIRTAVEMVLNIESEDFFIAEERPQRRGNLFLLPRESKPLMTFKGQLRMKNEDAYNHLDALFKPLNLLPIFREEKGQHVIYVIQGRARPVSGGEVLSLILFLATLASVLYVGTIMAINEISFTNPQEAFRVAQNFWMELWRGLPYAVSILLILGAHELGHYFMARRHRTAASLPYFLPFPFSLFGTFGAAIRLREPMRNRKVLFDIGAAGPLAGLIFAIPILFIGLATSPVAPMTPETGGLQEGNSIVYALAKIIVFGRFLPDGNFDVYVNQLAWAGWTGLLVTGLNLIPVGQLDGGHILYSLLGKRARQLYYPFMGALILLTIFVARELFLFVLLIMLMGNHHAVPLDDITPLDRRRQRMAVFTLMVFFLVFVPAPLTQIMPQPPVPGGTIGLPVVMVMLWLARRQIMPVFYRLTKR